MQDNDLGAGHAPGRGRGMLIAFLAGLVVGILVTVVVQPRISRGLPEAVRGKYEVLQGPVTAKQKQGENLLLTISTPAGAILATFKKQVAEINLLVENGDTVALDVRDYQPFMQNPHIVRVAKPGMAQSPPPQLPEAAEPESEPPESAPTKSGQAEGAEPPGAAPDTTAATDSIA